MESHMILQHGTMLFLEIFGQQFQAHQSHSNRNRCAKTTYKFRLTRNPNLLKASQ